jgi:hypothetical protein
MIVKNLNKKILKILYMAAFQSCEVLNFSFSNCLNLNAYVLCCDCSVILKFCRIVGGSFGKNFGAIKSYFIYKGKGLMDS